MSKTCTHLKKKRKKEIKVARFVLRTRQGALITIGKEKKMGIKS
jgi:hypothetical protein